MTFKLGVTLYSMTNEWVTQRYDLAGLLARAAESGIGPGIEVVGFQTIRGFPQVDAAFAAEFRGLLDQHGFQPSCLGSNIDIALRSDRFMTTGESVEYLSKQIDAARLLGFPVLRIQMGATPEVIERVAPLAEQSGVKLGMEIHAPEGATTPSVLAVREVYDKIGSSHLGFIPDFSSTMHAVPRGMLDSLVARGLPAQHAADLAQIWTDDSPPMERYGRFAEQARADGVDDSVLQAALLVFTMFGHQDVDSWRELMPQVFHVHGKFYEIDDSGTEPSIDYVRHIGILADSGFDGFISTEWEGHGWLDAEDVDAFTLVARHHDMIRRILGDPVPATM